MAYGFLRIDWTGKRVLVVGGGPVGLRKAKKCMELGAEVTLVSPTMAYDLEGLFRLHRREVEKRDVEGMFLVIAATNVKNVNEEIASWCLEKEILVNVADDRELGDVHLVKELDAGGVQVGLSTAHGIPFALRPIGEDVRKALLPWSHGRMELLAKIRQEMIEQGLSEEDKRRIYAILLSLGEEGLESFSLAEELEK
ncbi:MAG: NAD(P)-dependent oxidoreductase [Tissierellia bacterium]|nr:NAD(P)-dependent oxidoreductase [Tissierellia bacterium]